VSAYPIGIATVAEVGVFLGATLYAASLGAADVAAHTMTLRIAGVAYAIPTALLQASMVRLARADSLGDAIGAHAVVRASLTLSLICGTCVCMLLALGAGPLSGLLFDHSVAGLAAAAIAFKLLLLLGLLEFVANPCLAAAGLLRARKDTRAPMLYTLVGYWAVGAPLGIALCEVAGLRATGLWLGLAAGTLVATVLTLSRLALRSGAPVAVQR
jgi:MATE family multidrug resistance protein